MTELEKIYKYISENDGNVDVYSDMDEKEVREIFSNMRHYERPDILSIINNKIIVIEHFEFDSYKNTSKGSDYKIQDNIIEKKIKSEIDKQLRKNKDAITEEKVKNNGTLKNYYENFKKIFLSHIDNINEYKNHIIEDYGDSYKIEFWFFAEDVSPLGNYYKRQNINPLFPFSQETINILKEHPEINGLIIGFLNFTTHKLLIFKNDRKTIKKLQNDERMKVVEDEYFVFDPIKVGFASIIPKEELGVDDTNEQ